MPVLICIAPIHLRRVAALVNLGKSISVQITICIWIFLDFSGTKHLKSQRQFS